MLIKYAPSDLVASKKYNVNLMFEYLELYIESHQAMKQLYMLEFSLMDEEMQETLKPKLVEMEEIIESQNWQLQSVLRPAEENGVELAEIVFASAEQLDGFEKRKVKY